MSLSNCPSFDEVVERMHKYARDNEQLMGCPLRPCDIHDFADAAAAAHKREVVEVSVKAATIAIRQSNRSWEAKAGDMAQLRETLAQIRHLIEVRRRVTGVGFCSDSSIFYLIDEALGSPSRPDESGDSSDLRTKGGVK